MEKINCPKNKMASGRTHIHLVRHGHVHNPRHIVYGRLPRFRLSDRGIEQARSAAVFFHDLPITALYSSPLLRARQTANELRRATRQNKIRTSRLITEIHSPFEGGPSEAADALRGDVYTGAGPDFEQPEDILGRTMEFFKRVTRWHGSHGVAAVTHGDVITFALLWAKGVALHPSYKGRLGPLGIPSGYPSHGSVTTFIINSDRSDALPEVSYWEPET